MVAFKCIDKGILLPTPINNNNKTNSLREKEHLTCGAYISVRETSFIFLLSYLPVFSFPGVLGPLQTLFFFLPSMMFLCHYSRGWMSE